MKNTVSVSRFKTIAIGATLLIVAAFIFPAYTRHSSKGEHMTIEQNKVTARRWSEELWGKSNLAAADEIIAPNYVRHDPGDPFPARGPEDVKRIVMMLRTMLPDFRIQVEAMVAEGDYVVSRYTTTATDTRLHGKSCHWQEHSNLSDANVQI